ncbi:MAG: phospho-N-acetylmuramoyl-pentapeptide-transferase [Clostridia bacterium]|nr:phospho-N-acetylmuramoyl-pentapeptide-transferase [Clostridia bacterium]
MMMFMLAFLTSFLVTVVLMPLVIKFFRRMRYGQTILGYVEEHKEKNGTPTMGGVVFLLVPLALSFCFLKYDVNWFMCLIVSVFFGVLGFMDDFIKIKFKQNLGLRPYQKIIGQVGISIIFALFVYFTLGGKFFVPFTQTQVDIKFWIIPLILLVLVATTNSVNLTDGLDGLAGSVTFVYLVFFAVILSIVSTSLYSQGEVGKILEDINNVNTLCMLFAGSVLGFLMFNTNKASIFMGDVGSLCLGGFVGASACLVGQEFLLLILGFCFVFSAVSVILQVMVFKLTKKRIFKMAPFHHHLQMSGLTEPKIVVIYSAVTMCLGAVCIILYLL